MTNTPVPSREANPGRKDNAMYYINYHTGAAYTQQDITIEDEAGNVVAIRRWYGVQYNKDEDDAETPICFGDFGYYADWCRL